MADEDIIGVWREFREEDAALHQMAQNHQLMYEQTIANLAALKSISDDGIEEAVKNL